MSGLKFAILDRLLACARVIPPGFAWWLGGVLGDAFGRLPMRDQGRARAHLARAFPERGRWWIERTARASFRHVGRMALATLATLDRDAHGLRKGVLVEGAEHVRALLAATRRGEGTVCFTGHFGNWELFARIGGALIPLTVVGRRLRNPLADHLVQGARTRSGARLLYQDSPIRAFVHELRAGRMLAVLIDQDIPRLPGAFVPWFGIPAHTPTGPAGLALLTGAAAQPAFLYRRAGRWVLHAGPRRRFPRSGDRDADAAAITAWATAYEEALVRRHPEQWVWWHRRWHTRPQEGGKGKDRRGEGEGKRAEGEKAG